jgi:hypothetical protein
MAQPITQSLYERAIFNNERRVTLSFSPSRPSFALPWLILTSSIITLLFLDRLNRMATDIDSLAAGLDGHVLGLGIGTKGLRKNGNPYNFFRCTHFFKVGSLANALSKIPIIRLTSLNNTTDSFGTTGQGSPSSFRSLFH